MQPGECGLPHTPLVDAALSADAASTQWRLPRELRSSSRSTLKSPLGLQACATTPDEWARQKLVYQAIYRPRKTKRGPKTTFLSIFKRKTCLKISLTHPIVLSIFAMKSFPPAGGAAPGGAPAPGAPGMGPIPAPPPIIFNKPGASWRMTSCARWI